MLGETFHFGWTQAVTKVWTFLAIHGNISTLAGPDPDGVELGSTGVPTAMRQQVKVGNVARKPVRMDAE